MARRCGRCRCCDAAGCSAGSTALRPAGRSAGTRGRRGRRRRSPSDASTSTTRWPRPELARAEPADGRGDRNWRRGGGRWNEQLERVSAGSVACTSAPTCGGASRLRNSPSRPGAGRGEPAGELVEIRQVATSHPSRRGARSSLHGARAAPAGRPSAAGRSPSSRPVADRQAEHLASRTRPVVEPCRLDPDVAEVGDAHGAPTTTRDRRARPGPDPRELVRGRHDAVRVADVLQRRLVELRREATATVVDEHDVVVVHEAVAGGRLDAAVRRDARHDEDSAAGAAQDEVEVGTDESAVAVLLHDGLTAARARRRRTRRPKSPAGR